MDTLTVAGVVGGLLVLLFFWLQKEQSPEVAVSEESKPVSEPAHEALKTKQKPPEKRKKPAKKAFIEPEELLTTLKGHTGNVLDVVFSPSGKVGGCSSG